MARWVEDEKRIRTPSGRAKLAARAKPYWMGITEGVHLGYRRPQTGQGSWIARSLVDGKYREKAIGKADDGDVEADGKKVLTFAQASEIAQQARMDAGAMNAPITVQVAVTSYIKFLEAHRKTSVDTDQRLKKWAIPELGDKAINDLTKTQIGEWHASMVRVAEDREDEEDLEDERKSKDSANRVLTMLKAALNLAIQDEKNDIKSDAAWRLVKPFKGVGRARKVFLSPEQCKTLMDNCEGDFLNLVKAGLHTGARYGEVASLNVGDFSHNLGILHLRDGKTGPRDIYLTKDGAQFFRDLTEGRDAKDPLILRDGGRWHKSEQHRPMKAAVEAAGLDPKTTYYSLRHSYASQALLSGMQMQLLAENLGTSIKMIEDNYGKFLSHIRRELVETTAPRLA